MTEDEWLTCGDAMALLDYLQRRGCLDERKMRLLALSFLRKLWGILDKPCRAAVEVGERHVEGEAHDSDLDATLRNLECPVLLPRGNPDFHKALSQYNAVSAIHYALASKREVDAGRFHLAVGSLVVNGRAVMTVSAFHATVLALAEHQAATSGGEAIVELELKREIGRHLLPLYHDVLGNPFRPVVVPSAWRTPEVMALAARIYDGREFDRMPELAGALDRAGCTVAEILAHCRSQAEHVRGCWVVDSVLGRSRLNGTPEP